MAAYQTIPQTKDEGIRRFLEFIRHYFGRNRETTFMTDPIMGEKQYTVPRDYHFEEQLNTLGVEQTNGSKIHKVTINTDTKSAVYAYIWDNDRQLTCLGGAPTDEIITWHCDPLNVALLWELFEMDVLVVEQRKYLLFPDGYDIVVREITPPEVAAMELPRIPDDGVIPRLPLDKTCNTKECHMQAMPTEVTETEHHIKQDKEFTVALKRVYMYKPKPEDGNHRRVKIGTHANFVIFEYHANSDDYAQCIFNGKIAARDLINYHSKPFNVALIATAMGIRTLRVGVTEYQVDKLGYDIKVTEWAPIVKDPTDADKARREAVSGRETEMERPIPTETWKAKPASATAMAAAGKYKESMQAPAMEEQTPPIPEEDVPTTPTDGVRVKSEDELRLAVQTFHELVMETFKLLDYHPQQFPPVDRYPPPNVTDYPNAQPGVFSGYMRQASVPPNPSSLTNGFVPPPVHLMLHNVDSPMLSRMLEELSWQPEYEYMLLEHRLIITQEPDGQYQVKCQVPQTPLIMVVNYTHQRATPPFSLL